MTSTADTVVVVVTPAAAVCEIPAESENAELLRASAEASRIETASKSKSCVEVVVVVVEEPGAAAAAAVE